MNKIVFLDRDGVVNVERGDYTWKIEDFKLTCGLINFLKAVHEKGYLVIIISNQGCIGKGVCSKADVESAHQFLKEELAKQHLFLTDIYYCPHHPNKTRCLCRKPESVMLEKALARYNAQKENCFFIGDTERDMEAGKRAGLKTIKIEPNEDLTGYIKYFP